MEKVTEICYSNSLKINKGNYEQEAPFYSAKTILKGDVNETAEYNRLRGIIDPILMAQYNEFALKENGLRIREKGGVKYPSVTSILNPERYTGDPSYGVRGKEIHRIFNHFVKTREIIEPNESVDIGKLKYPNYKKFLKEYGVLIGKKTEVEIEVFNDRLLFSGEIDLLDESVLSDIKTGNYKWEQLVAYNESLERRRELLRVFDLKNNTVAELEVSSKNYQELWENFLVLRGMFKQRFKL